MCPSVAALFDILRQRVTEQDIRDFSPGDPGYPAYVRLWLQILATGEVPRKSEFDLTEVIGMTGWASPNYFPCPRRFCTYRLLTSSVACHLYLTGNCSEDVRPANYTAIRLINDVKILEDAELSSLVGSVLCEVAESLKSQEWLEEEHPFFHAAEMIWAQRIGDYQRSANAANALIRSDQIVRQHHDFFAGDSRFLYGLTVYDQLYAEWHQALSELTNPNSSEDLQLVIETLSSGTSGCTT